MRDELISEVVQRMLPYLDNKQLVNLQNNLNQVLQRYDVELIDGGNSENDNQELVEKFISAKRVEGCSEKTLKYYLTTIEAMNSSLEKDVRIIQTEDLRKYLTDYQMQNGSSKVTIDNIRRILSSFFAWLEDEDYIIKSPVRRIHKVKTVSNIKETYTDEELELMRDNCEELRDLAIVAARSLLTRIITVSYPPTYFGRSSLRHKVSFGPSSR